MGLVGCYKVIKVEERKEGKICKSIWVYNLCRSYKKKIYMYDCKYKFTEQVTIQRENKNISNKVEQKVLKDLKQYNLSLKYIAEENNISDNTVRNILKEHMKDYSKNIINLPRVILFDEFKADTTEGKYAFKLNAPIHKKVLDILPNRKKRVSRTVFYIYRKIDTQ